MTPELRGERGRAFEAVKRRGAYLALKGGLPLLVTVGARHCASTRPVTPRDCARVPTSLQEGAAGQGEGTSQATAQTYAYTTRGVCAPCDVALTPCYLLLLQPPLQFEVRGVRCAARARRGGVWVGCTAERHVQPPLQLEVRCVS